MGTRTQTLDESIAIMARLRGPDGCPWDREQTFDSIKRHTLEETYEVFDAIDRRAWDDLKDELGDLLLQVLFYSQMAEDAGYFSIEQVAEGLNAKLIRRHPHVFGDAVAATSLDVERTWKGVKEAEKAGKAAPPGGVLGRVPEFQPALLEAHQIGKAAAKVGFDWPDAEGVLAKVEEEVAEVRAELAVRPSDSTRLRAEVGDLLFSAVQLARHLELDPEFTLRLANVKFRKRFAAMEKLCDPPGGLKGKASAELEELWAEAKQRTGKTNDSAVPASEDESRPDNSLQE